MTGAWNEYSVTWNTQPASTTEHQIAVPAPSSGTDSLVQDVLPLVKDILNSEEGNHGFELILQNEQKYRSVRYASTQHSDAARWPKLTITYTQVNEAYYLKDHLGNIRVTLDGNGNVLTTDDYYPFGLSERSGDPETSGQMPRRSYNIAMTGNQYKFSGKELDTEGGLDWYYFGARYYDPVIGRWLSIDPRKYPSWSSYTFVFNNPIKYFDNNGENGEDVSRVAAKYDKKYFYFWGGYIPNDQLISNLGRYYKGVSTRISKILFFLKTTIEGVGLHNSCLGYDCGGWVKFLNDSNPDRSYILPKGTENMWSFFNMMDAYNVYSNPALLQEGDFIIKKGGGHIVAVVRDPKSGHLVVSEAKESGTKVGTKNRSLEYFREQMKEGKYFGVHDKGNDKNIFPYSRRFIFFPNNKSPMQLFQNVSGSTQPSDM